VFEARNSKSEIRNNQIDQKKQNSKQEFLEFGIHNSDLCFGFVSDFGAPVKKPARCCE